MHSKLSRILFCKIRWNIEVSTSRTDEREKKHLYRVKLKQRNDFSQAKHCSNNSKNTVSAEYTRMVVLSGARSCTVLRYFLHFSPLRDHQAKTRLKAVFWERYTGHDALEIATALPLVVFFLYISIIIRSRLYGIKMQHPVVELKLLTRESWRMKISSFLFLRFREIAWFAFEFWACASLH